MSHGKRLLTATSTGRNAAQARMSSVTTTKRNTSRVQVDSDMGPNLGHGANPENNPDAVSVDVRSRYDRLGKRWGVNGRTAKWLIYSTERGLVARVIDGMDEMGAVKAEQWIKPIVEHIKEMQKREGSVTLRTALELDAEGDAAVGRYLTDDDGDRSDTRDEAIRAVERKAAAWNCQAALWRAEREAERG